MRSIRGVAASKGIAIGKLCIRQPYAQTEHLLSSEDAQVEIQRLDAARIAAEQNIRQLYRQAFQKFGAEDSLIFKSHILLLEDHDFFEDIQKHILQDHVTAESAVYMTAQHFYQLFSKMEDEYMRARDTDILDISRHLLRYLNLENVEPLYESIGKGIIAVEELLPSEVVTVNRKKVLAFLSQNGSCYSHAAILLRNAGIPFVVGLKESFKGLVQAENVIVDGFTGDVVLSPDVMALREYSDRQYQYFLHLRALRELRGCPSVTKDGYRIDVHANIGHAEDVQQVLDNDADGIGLLRTEFLYLGSNMDCSEEGQFRAYKMVLEKMHGKRVVIRTLDISEEPEIGQWRYSDRINPAMGCRAIRFSLRRPGLFMTQLRAILRASAYGRVAIMFPIITSEQEIVRAKTLLQQAQKELSDQGIEVADRIEIGAMVETPAAVLLSDKLASHVDFLSIGTNDLTQYTLAVDRMNPSVTALYNPRHPAVLRMIDIAVKNAKKHGIRIEICGESAADSALLCFYLALGVDELSVAPSSVLEIRRMIRQITLGENKEHIIRQFCREPGEITDKRA